MTVFTKMLGAGVLALFAAGCSNGNNSTDTGTGNNDAGNGSDVMTTTDSGSTTDTGTPTDTGSTGTDSGTPTDASTATGTCGATVHSCLCGCGTAANQQQCQQNCLSSSATTCRQCISMQYMNCCPSEYSAFATCAQAATMAGADGGAPQCSGTDSACLMSACPSQYSAYASCVMTQSGTAGSACQTDLGTCFGTYPIACN